MKNSEEEYKLTKVFTDNGEISHYRLIRLSDGQNVWSSFPEECKAMGFPVEQTDLYERTCEKLLKDNDDLVDLNKELQQEVDRLKETLKFSKSVINEALQNDIHFGDVGAWKDCLSQINENL
jgi:hypothetical protein